VRQARRWLALVVLLLAACGTPIPEDAACHENRSWYPRRAAEGVWDDCVRHFGAEWCRKCLWQ